MATLSICINAPLVTDPFYLDCGDWHSQGGEGGREGDTKPRAREAPSHCPEERPESKRRWRGGGRVYRKGGAGRVYRQWGRRPHTALAWKAHGHACCTELLPSESPPPKSGCFDMRNHENRRSDFPSEARLTDGSSDSTSFRLCLRAPPQTRTSAQEAILVSPLERCAKKALLGVRSTWFWDLFSFPSAAKGLSTPRAGGGAAPLP